MEHRVKILRIEQLIYNVRRITVEKPGGYVFVPGQATDVLVDVPALRNEKRPFTFTSLNSDSTLEFTIKSYTDHAGVTKAIGELHPGDHLIIDDPWGAIEYKGPGIFIAGGAGLTPFLAILRQLKKEKKAGGNILLFSNKTFRDIFLKNELDAMDGLQCKYILTREKHDNCICDRIDKKFLQQQNFPMQKHFYVCGPDAFVKEITATLEDLGAKTEQLVFEK